MRCPYCGSANTQVKELKQRVLPKVAVDEISAYRRMPNEYRTVAWLSVSP